MNFKFYIVFFPAQLKQICVAIHFAGERPDCPIKLSPPSVVVRYGEPVSINCSTLTDQNDGIGWEATNGGSGVKSVSHLNWTVDRLTEWSASPFCFINLRLGSPFQQCKVYPKVVVYSESHF